MCYVRIELTEGFFHTDGFGYIMDFTKHEAKIIPFTPQISLLPIQAGDVNADTKHSGCNLRGTRPAAFDLLYFYAV